jgi:YesN/AraC family two-component response regulator
VSIFIGGHEFPLVFGDVLLIPPGISHHAEVHDMERPYRRFVFWISAHYAAQLMYQEKEYGYLIQYVLQNQEYVFHQDLVTSNEIHSKVFRLLSEVHSKRFGKEAQIHVCIQDLLLLLNRKVYEQKHPVSNTESMTLYQNILLFIEEHLDENLSLERLANEYYISKYYISHLFKDNAGFSMHQYVVKKRLNLCKDAILANPAITDVFQQFGFTDYTSFYRAFKKEYGMSPKEYREVNVRVDELER